MTFTDRERRYLHEMGIDVWVNRSEGQSEPVPVRVASIPVVEPKASSAREGNATEAEVPHTAVTSNTVAPAALPGVTEADTAVMPEFRLDLATCRSSELLALGCAIDAMDARLLQNIVMAATGPTHDSRVSHSTSGGSSHGSSRGSSALSSGLPVLSSFRWPQVKTMEGAGVAGAAKALRAYLLRQIKENGISRVLLLGDVLVQLTLQSDDFLNALKGRDGSSVQTLQGPDLRYLRYHGDAKRVLWQELSRWRR